MFQITIVAMECVADHKSCISQEVVDLVFQVTRVALYCASDYNSSNGLC